MKKKEKIEIPDLELLELWIEFVAEGTERKFKEWVKDKIKEKEDKK